MICAPRRSLTRGTTRERKEHALKLLLTSAGIKNPSINDAMLELLGKPIAECDALCIPTASYGHAPGGIHGAWRFITGQATTPMCELGWKSLGVLELTALPSIGVSAGSLVMGPDVGEEFVYGSPLTGGGDKGPGLVDFAMFRHLDHEAMPDHSMANAERWAAGVPVLGYAIDDETAIKVVDNTVEVVSEGHWKLFTSNP